MPSPVSTLRRFLFVQLDSRAWTKKFMSPANAIFLGLIAFNIALLVLETEPVVVQKLGQDLFHRTEYVLLRIFAAEFLLRLWVAGEREEFRGILGRLRWLVQSVVLIDVVAIVPGFLPHASSSTTVLRVFRLVRVLRFGRFGGVGLALSLFRDVFVKRQYELVVSLALVLCFVLGSSTLMYLVEGDSTPEWFGSIPRALWWSIITMTTVGYGDVFPKTPLGKFVAALTAIAGIASVAVPTGILASAFTEVIQDRKKLAERSKVES